jgi:hypothetical protein
MKKTIIFLIITLSFIELYSQKDIAGIYTTMSDTILLNVDNSFYYVLKDVLRSDKPDIKKVTGKWKYLDGVLILEAEKVLLNKYNGEFFGKYKFFPDTCSIVAEACGINSIFYKMCSYYNDGKIKTEFKYKDYKLNGELITYFKNGNINVKRIFKNGVKVGKWEYYDESSRLIMTEKYKKGKLLFTELPPPDKI